MCFGLILWNSVRQLKNFMLCDPNKKFVAVFCDPRYKESLSDALVLPTSITDSIIEGHMVNLRAIISRLIEKRTYGVSNNI